MEPKMHVHTYVIKFCIPASNNNVVLYSPDKGTFADYIINISCDVEVNDLSKNVYRIFEIFL